jgi:hypothetical protein
MAEAPAAPSGSQGSGLNRRIGGIPVWAIVVAGSGLAFYLYQRRASAKKKAAATGAKTTKTAKGTAGSSIAPVEGTSTGGFITTNTGQYYAPSNSNYETPQVLQTILGKLQAMQAEQTAAKKSPPVTGTPTPIPIKPKRPKPIRPKGPGKPVPRQPE